LTPETWTAIAFCLAFATLVFNIRMAEKLHELWEAVTEHSRALLELDADIRAKEAAVKKQLERYRFGERA
jgi:hypothetical protein